MQDNPIYGNIIYSPSSTTLTIGGDPQPASSMRDQHRVNSESQDCYANLTVKAPRSQSGQVSSLTQYPEAVYLVEQPDSEMKDEGNPDTVSTVSDLYASVQNQRTKTVQTADSGEGYANHL
ncbi:sit1 [Pungitius sinensis]